MPVRAQVLDRRAGAAAVVGEHVVGVDRLRRAVHEHEPDARRDVALEIRVVVAVGTRMSPSTRRPSTPSTNSRSRSGSASELPANVTTDRSRATSSTPRWMAAKNGLPTSSKIRPIVDESPLARRSVPAVWLWR